METPEIALNDVPDYIHDFIYWYENKHVFVEFEHVLLEHTFCLKFHRTELEEFLVSLGLNEFTGHFVLDESNELTVRDLVKNMQVQPKEIYAFVKSKNYIINEKLYKY